MTLNEITERIIDEMLAVWEVSGRERAIEVTEKRLNEAVHEAKSEILRELDKKYNSYCETKISTAISYFEDKLKEAEQMNSLNSESIRRGRARNITLLEGIDKALSDIRAICQERGPMSCGCLPEISKTCDSHYLIDGIESVCNGVRMEFLK